MKPIRALTVALVFCLPAFPVQADDDSHHAHAGGSASHELHEVMTKSAAQAPSMKMSGDVDKDFARMMADHHRSGIEMAQIEVENGKDPEVKKLAQKIISAQKEELATLEKHASMSHD